MPSMPAVLVQIVNQDLGARPHSLRGDPVIGFLTMGLNYTGERRRQAFPQASGRVTSPPPSEGYGRVGGDADRAAGCHRQSGHGCRPAAIEAGSTRAVKI